MYGKNIRLFRIINQHTNKVCIVPIDHGTTLGPILGIENSIKTISNLVKGGVDGIVLHKGILKLVAQHPELSNCRYIMHLSVSTILNGNPTNKVIVSSVEEAVKYGADGVSIHVNCGDSYESEMIRSFGKVAEACLHWGMPLLVMIYNCNDQYDTKKIAHVARIAEELGADLIKVDYPGSPEEMRYVVERVNVPVIISGGLKKDESVEIFKLVQDAIDGGAAGISFGRNIFQQEDQSFFAGLLCDLVHGRTSVNECEIQFLSTIKQQVILPD